MSGPLRLVNHKANSAMIAVIDEMTTSGLWKDERSKACVSVDLTYRLLVLLVMGFIVYILRKILRAPDIADK